MTAVAHAHRRGLELHVWQLPVGVIVGVGALTNVELLGPVVVVVVVGGVGWGRGEVCLSSVPCFVLQRLLGWHLQGWDGVGISVGIATRHCRARTYARVLGQTPMALAVFHCVAVPKPRSPAALHGRPDRVVHSARVCRMPAVLNVVGVVSGCATGCVVCFAPCNFKCCNVRCVQVCVRVCRTVHTIVHVQVYVCGTV